MSAQTMLNKIMTLLSVKAEVELTYGQLKDGTILESNTFDVGETIDVYVEDKLFNMIEKEKSVKIDEASFQNLLKFEEIIFNEATI
jgi:hypothetical protein